MNDQLKAMAMDDMVASAMRAKGKASKSTPQRGGRATRRMGSGLLENAPKREAETKSTPASTSSTRRMRSGGGDYPFTKSEPATTAKATPSMTTGSRSEMIGKAKSIAAKEGMLRGNAANAAKGAATIAAMEAAGPIMGAASALAAADEATGYKRTQYSGNFGGPSFNANPYSSKSSYPGQSTMSKLMGVGKKGK
jgi:hypothetical protein